jgi:hypothetical protein
MPEEFTRSRIGKKNTQWIWWVFLNPIEDKF